MSEVPTYFDDWITEVVLPPVWREPRPVHRPDPARMARIRARMRKRMREMTHPVEVWESEGGAIR